MSGVVCTDQAYRGRVQNQEGLLDLTVVGYSVVGHLLDRQYIYQALFSMRLSTRCMDSNVLCADLLLWPRDGTIDR